MTQSQVAKTSRRVQLRFRLTEHKTVCPTPDKLLSPQWQTIIFRTKTCHMHTYLWRQCPCFPPWRAALEIRPPLALAVIIPGYGWLSKMTGHYSGTCVVPLSSLCIRWTTDKHMFYSYLCTSRLKCRRSGSQTPADYLSTPQTEWNR